MERKLLNRVLNIEDKLEGVEELKAMRDALLNVEAKTY